MVQQPGRCKLATGRDDRSPPRDAMVTKIQNRVVSVAPDAGRPEVSGVYTGI
jgi:hypothetical protein